MTISTPNQNTLATAKFRAEDKLYIFGLDQVWTGLVNMASPDRGVQKIVYDGGALQGDFNSLANDLQSGLWVWFGSTSGARDVGEARLLAFGAGETTGTLTIEWHDHIHLSDNDFITIVHHYIPAAKFSNFTVANGLHKDGPPSPAGDGIAYSDQNEEPPPDVVMGRPLVTTSQTAHQVDATRSKAMAPGATITTSAWTVSPSNLGTFASASSQRTTFTPANGVYGQGYLHFKATDSNGNVSTGHRPIIVDNPSSPTHVSEFQLSPINQSKGNANIAATVTLTSPDSSATAKGPYPDTDWSKIKKLSQVIITRDSYFDGSLSDISRDTDEDYDHRRNVLYVGYVVGETRRMTGNGAASIQVRLAQAPLSLFIFSQSITGTPAADVDKWYEAIGDLMTQEQLGFHYFYYHSTLKEIMDINLPRADSIRRSANDEWVAGGLIERLSSSVGSHGRLMDVTITPQGELYVEPYLNLADSSGRSVATTTLTLQDGHIVDGRGAVEVNYLPNTSQVLADGFASPDGLLGNGVPLRSISGNVRLPFGTGESQMRGVIPEDQTELNRWTGRLLQLANDRIVISLVFTEAFWAVFSPARQEWTDTGEVFQNTLMTNLRGDTDLEDVNLLPIAVNHSPQAGGTGFVEVTFEVELPDGLPGRTVPIPDIAPYYAQDNALPAANVFSPVPTNIMATGDDTNGFELYNGNAWLTRNSGLSDELLEINAIHEVPFWWIRQQSSDANNSIWWIATVGGLAFTSNGGTVWTVRTPIVSSLPSGTTQSDVNWCCIDSYGDKAAVGKVLWAACRVLDGSTYTSYLLRSTDYGATWTQSAMTTGDRILSVAADPEDSTELWIAYWQSSDTTFRVGKRDDSFAAVGSDTDFGTVTSGEVDAGTFSVKLKVVRDLSVTNYGERVFAYGRFNKT